MPDQSYPAHAMSKSEMTRRHQDAHSQCEVFLVAYLEFPTAQNFELLTQHMREYQEHWMHAAASGVL